MLIYIEILNVKYFVKIIIEYSHVSHASDNNEACRINISYPTFDFNHFIITNYCYNKLYVRIY